MSHLFNRPNPKTATVNDVQKAIDEITKWDWTTGYSFAHIVIDDKNLDDESILFCLRPNWIAETINQKLMDRFGHTDFRKLETGQWEQYKDIVRHMAEVIDLLNWLLDVPESIRDEVE